MARGLRLRFWKSSHGCSQSNAMKRALAFFGLLTLIGLVSLSVGPMVQPASAQGCGQGNPNCVAPTPPITPTCDDSNRIATTDFVAVCGGGGGGGGNPGGSINAVQF